MTRDNMRELHAAVGGDQPFIDLVEAFYAGLSVNPILRPMYPSDLSGAQSRLAQFLIQRFGGISHYSETRGHPRLRMRHMRFKIGVAEKQAWIILMSSALDSVSAFTRYRNEILNYFENTAAF